MTVQEPRFTRAEVATLVAARRERDKPRGSHGLPLAETTDPASQGRWLAEDPILDFAQDTIDRAQDAYKKRYPEANTSAMLWPVTRQST